MSKQKALDKIENLIKQINFSDISHSIAISMCEIIVKGKPTDYVFEPDPELTGYYGKKDNLWLDTLTESLLERAGLMEIDKKEGKVIIKPTDRALELYKEFKGEGKLDKRGYLDGKDTGFC